MKYFTKKWDDYINKEWKEYVGEERINVSSIKELYECNFTEELLESEFNKYYDAKKKYVSMYDYFEKEFGEYEKIKILSRDKEYEKYIERFSKLVKEFTNTLYYNSIDNLNNDDIKLLVLGKVNFITKETLEKKSISPRKLINKFISTYDEFCSKNKIMLPIKELDYFYFHDARIYLYEVKDNRIILDIDSDWDFNSSIKIEFIDATISEDLSKDMKLSNNSIDIYTADIRYYVDFGYYCYFELLIDDPNMMKMKKKKIIITSKDIIVVEHKTNDNY